MTGAQGDFQKASLEKLGTKEEVVLQGQAQISTTQSQSGQLGKATLTQLLLPAFKRQSPALVMPTWKLSVPPDQCTCLDTSRVSGSVDPHL